VYLLTAILLNYIWFNKKNQFLTFLFLGFQRVLTSTLWYGGQLLQGLACSEQCGRAKQLNCSLTIVEGP